MATSPMNAPNSKGKTAEKVLPLKTQKICRGAALAALATATQRAGTPPTAGSRAGGCGPAPSSWRQPGCRCGGGCCARGGVTRGCQTAARASPGTRRPVPAADPQRIHIRPEEVCVCVRGGERTRGKEEKKERMRSRG